jgi:putative NIF3 family GTP cyclohydrolase 1 type 2
MKHHEIPDVLSAIGAALRPSDGFGFGNPQTRTTGVTVAFTASLGAIAAAHRQGDNLLIIHERMFFPTAYSGAKLDRYLTERINLPRLSAAANAGITVLLLREGIENAYMRTALEQALGLPNADAPDALYEVHPTDVKAFSRQAMEACGVKSARLTDIPGKTVRHIAIMNGGEGITRTPDCMMRYLSSGADLILCGETDEYPKWAARDCGIALLELGHTALDNLGLRLLTSRLGEAVQGLPVHFYEIEKPWRVFRAEKER